MRKIERNLITAIRAGKTFIGGNTVFDGQTVTLHGNIIAKRVGDGFVYTLAGWNTPTTRSRINAVATIFGEHGVSCIQGVAHVAGQPVTDIEWF